MLKPTPSDGIAETVGPDQGRTREPRQAARVKADALQDAIFNSACFSSIATDENGIIQIFNVGAERMFGYAASDVVNLRTPADLSDPQELTLHAAGLSREFGTSIGAGFEALVYKAARGIEDIYALTYVCRDGRRLPAMVSVTALRDADQTIIGYLLIGTDNTARLQIDAVLAVLNQHYHDQPRHLASNVNLTNADLSPARRWTAAPEYNHPIIELRARRSATLHPYPPMGHVDRQARLQGHVRPPTQPRLQGDLTTAAANPFVARMEMLHFREIVASSHDAIISKTLDGRVCSWNDGATAIFGYTAAEMLGRPISVLFPTDRYEEENFIIEKIIGGEKVDHFETIRLHKDGRRINISATISAIHDHAGKVIGASKIARDITAQTRAEQRLELAASVFTNITEGILIADRCGSIIEVNDSFSRITGYDKQEVIGQDSRMFRSSRQGPEILQSIRMLLLRHGSWKGELWSRRKDGESYSVLLTVSKVRGPSGKVRNYVALFSDITVLKLQQEKLEHSAHFDALTNLPNRLLLSDRLHQAVAMSQRYGHGLAVLYLDLDGFKAVNDTYGHEVGDALLIAISERMRCVLRDVDTLARMGGDEFVAVLPDVDSSQDCIQLVRRVLTACAESVRIEGVELKISASIGVTMYPQDNAEADQLIRHADQAMYEAKQNGKNRIHLFDATQDAEVKSRSAQQERISEAILWQEFILHYQPKVNMHTGAVIGVEALIRWQHPERGLLAPGAFLPVIEKHPLSESLGAWVLEAALRQMQAWHHQGLTLRVSVNIAARHLQQQDFAAQLIALLASYPDINPNCLELEVLETSAFEDLSSVLDVMQECHRIGVRFAIDDFGTGYSSLTYLRRLPVETLKIDQSFVRDMLESQDDLAIVKGVIGLADAFRRMVIAEGVETIAHGKKLIELGCELAQGYQIARPMPGELVPAWSENWRPHVEWTSVERTVPAGSPE